MFAVDIGNSRIKWGLWQKNEFVLTGASYYRASSLAAVLDESWHGLCETQLPEQEKIWVSCVAGESIEQRLITWLSAHCDVDPVFLRASQSLGDVKNAYPEPSQHGVDRWAALLGARSLYQSPVCVVDCGTAVTVDVMDAQGNHLGGRIMPGLHMMRNSLLSDTDGLEARTDRTMSRLSDELPVFADNTTDAIASGTLHLLVAGLVEVCEQAQATLGASMKIIITGGLADEMLPLLNIPNLQHEPHLVLHGLVYASNH